MVSSGMAVSGMPLTYEEGFVCINRFGITDKRYYAEADGAPYYGWRRVDGMRY